MLLGFMVHLAAHGRQAQFFLLPEAFDFQDELDIGRAVETVPGGAAAGLQELALVLPIPQHVGLDPGDAAHFTDGIKGFAGDVLFHSGQWPVISSQKKI
jgi:hypothetical protein